MMWLILLTTALYVNAETVDGFHYYEDFCISKQRHELTDQIVTGVTIEECVAHCKVLWRTAKCRSIEFNPSDGECRPQDVKRPPKSDCSHAREGDKFYSPTVHSVFGYDPTASTTTSLPPAASKEEGCTDLAGPGMGPNWKDPNKCVMGGLYEEKENSATLEGCEKACMADDACNAIYYQRAPDGNDDFNLCASNICPKGKDTQFVADAKMQGQFKLCQTAVACTDLAGPGMGTDWKDPDKCVYSKIFDDSKDYESLETCEKACVADDTCNAVYYEQNVEPGFHFCGSHICPKGKDSKFVADAKMQGQFKLCDKEISVPKFNVGGTGTLNGATGVVVALNRFTKSEQTKTLNSDGEFTFDNQLSIGDRYDVTIKTAPSGYRCHPGKRYSSIISSDITNVEVLCSKIFSWDSSVKGERDVSCDGYCDYEDEVCFDCVSGGCLKCGVLEVIARSVPFSAHPVPFSAHPREEVAMTEQNNEWSVEDVAVYSLALVGVGAAGYTAYNAAFSPKPVTIHHESYTEDC